ncbi:MAG TPA: methyltransferase domain-containing protein [Alphaproteobacteria bacterium]|jgi:SAM-dependent methyltransferase
MLPRVVLKKFLPASLLPLARRSYFSLRDARRRLKARFSRRYAASLYAQDSGIFQMALRGSMNQNCCELHVFVQYRMLCGLAAKVGKTLGGHVLEVGACGHPGMALMLLLGGAEKVTLNNIFAIQNRLPRSWAENAHVLMRLTGTPKRSLDSIVEPLEDGFVRVRPELLDLPAPCPCETLAFPAESFDVIFSNAVLEHVRDPVPVLRNLHDMMAMGGWYAHAIDLRDHWDFDRPLAFLSLSDAEFRSLDPYSNRYRSSDWVGSFHAAALTTDYVALSAPQPLTHEKGTDTYRIVLTENIPPDEAAAQKVVSWVTNDARAHMAPEFHGHGLDVLSVTSMLVAGRKRETR